jgi:[methyl-Co(III) methanol-specific corrinoid protein]:coenzyme M methyltransferase
MGGLLDVLTQKNGDSVSVLCPGGMMSAAVTEVMDACGASWPAAHTNAAEMSRLAVAMHDATGFGNIALPFCMTIEAECYGAHVAFGTAVAQPRTRGTVLPADASGALAKAHVGEGRGKGLAEAISLARRERPRTPIVGNVVGPFSLLGMLADPLALLRWTRRKPARVAEYMTEVTSFLVDFARMQVKAGADVICVAEPTATGEILGGERFGAIVKPHLDRLARSLHELGAPAILHICGDASCIIEELLTLPFDAVSFDSKVNIVSIVRSRPRWLPMGNVSPFLLEEGPESAVRETCLRLVAGGVRLVAPGCGIVPSTPVANLRAMSEACNRRDAGGA